MDEVNAHSIAVVSARVPGRYGLRFRYRTAKPHIYFYKRCMCGYSFMEYERENEGLKSRLASAAGMPKDVVLGAAVVTLLGDSEVCIENYRGIIEYTECLIRVQTKGKQIRLHGRHLQIEYYTNDEMKITGTICSLEFCK